MPSTQPSYNRDYYLNNKTRIQEYARNYRKNNRDKLLDYGKNYYKHHTERCRYLNIKWKIKNIPNYGKKKKHTPQFRKITQPILVTFD